MYPNAANGVKKIFIAEILALVAVILGLAAKVADIILSASQGMDEGASAVVTVLGLSMGVVALISFFLNIVGVNIASRDETAFRYAAYAIIVGIVCTLVNGFFNVNDNDIVRDLFEIVTDMASLIVTIFIIIGIRNLAKSLHDAKMEKKGNTLLNLVFVITAIAMIDKAVLLVIRDQTVVLIAGICAIAAAVLSVVKYILYLSYLAKANRMLNEA